MLLHSRGYVDRLAGSQCYDRFFDIRMLAFDIAEADGFCRGGYLVLTFVTLTLKIDSTALLMSALVASMRTLNSTLFLLRRPRSIFP